MESRSSENKSNFRKIIRNTFFWTLIGLMLIVVLFFVILPIGIENGIERFLKEQGAEQVSLEDVDFNPISGRMTTTNLTVKTATRTALIVPEATFKIQWAPFIRKRFVLQSFTISDTQLIVEELENGRLQIGGIIIPENKKPAEPAAWDFSIQNAAVRNCKVQFISSPGQNQS